MSARHQRLRRFHRATPTVLGIVVPFLLICAALAAVALWPDDGWTLTWTERSRIVIHPWGR